MTNREKLIEIVDAFLTKRYDGEEFEHRDNSIGLIAALEAYGVRLVPVRITPEMGWELENTIADPLPASEVHAANWQSGYTAMIAASPYAPGV